MWARVRPVIWAVPVAVTVTDLLGSVIKVEGVSMQPTFNPPGSTGSDWVLVEKLTIKALHRHTRGEVVVLWAPDDPHQQIIKRMIAVEGDTVSVPPTAADDGADDGGASSSSSRKASSKRGTASTSTPTVQRIPPGRCWVEGDNAARSGDSRSAYGPVHLGLLEGRVTHVLWPPSRAGRVAAAVPRGRVVPGEPPDVA